MFYRLIKVVFHPKYLLCTNVTLSTTLAALGDVLEQKYEILTKEELLWDKKRTLQMGVAGTTVGLVSHFWYMYLEKIVPQSGLRAVARKLVLDQLIGSPICISTLVVTLSLLHGCTFEEFKDEVKRKTWRLYLGECIIWTPLQFINFYYLPIQYRLLYDNLISLAYDIFASYVMHDLPEDVAKRHC